MFNKLYIMLNESLINDNKLVSYQHHNISKSNQLKQPILHFYASYKMLVQLMEFQSCELKRTCKFVILKVNFEVHVSPKTISRTSD
jgi:hypothetical protein